MNKPGTAHAIELAPGVVFDCHVGEHNQARGLNTGLVTFAPAARLTYHTHPCSESLTVLSGSMVIAVEGREYSLGALDNIVIPRGLAHRGWNTSANLRSTVHVAFGSSSPPRESAASPPESCAMPADSPGLPGKERVTRMSTASHYEAGPGTSFVDHCNRDLVPGTEMSGGYGMFAPGGRLPAHLHDFDESICIVQGEATCVVEGRHHRLQSPSTALQPRGRVHYFANTSPDPMAMIWVYAGPVPERILVDERCAMIEGDPWKRKASGP
jgi:quercetin dioxygenase-like cupin family protein